jgi:hypothetical protein
MGKLEAHDPSVAVGRRHLPTLCVGRKTYAAGCTFIQWRAISSRVATQTLGFDAT